MTGRLPAAAVRVAAVRVAAVHVVVIVTACTAVAMVTGVAAAQVAEPLDRVLAPLTAAVGAAAAVLGVVVARMTGERRPAVVAAICSTQVLYCVVLPLNGLNARNDAAGPAGIAVAALLAIGWTVAALDAMVDGLRRGDRARLRLGLGLAVPTCAELQQVLGSAVAPGLLLFGLVVVLFVFARSVAATVREWESDRWRQQEEASAAALQMQRMLDVAAERDHELRNGLAGLAGVAHLFSGDPDLGGPDSSTPDEDERLRHGVRAELGRLNTLLEGPPMTGEQPGRDYLVRPVLSGLAVLRPAATLDVADGLAARGDPEALAQVMTNLLANCERHAPGSPVTITARRTGGEVVVEVRDRGPGLAPGAELEVLRRGVRDAAAGGTGLGLDISARLVARQGGTLTLRTVDAPRGCLVTVTLPGGGNRLPTDTHRKDFHRV